MALMTMNGKLGLTLLASLGLALAACSDDGGSGGNETSGSETGTTTGDGDGDGDGTETGTNSGDGDGDTAGDGDGDPAGDGDGDTAGDGDGDTAGDGDGDTAGDGDGDTAGDGDGDMGDGDGDTGDGDGDTSGDGDGDDPNMYAPWIISVDEPDQTTDRLIQIIVDGNDFGQVNVICEDIELPDTIPANTAFTSLTFNSNVLYASVRKGQVNGDTLLRIDPCTCTSTEIGQYSGYDGLNGITSNAIQTMFGASTTSDVIIDIDPNTAASVEVAALPGDWGSTGLTWSDPVDNVLYGINASVDRLYTFDGDDASELASVQLDSNFSSVGIEYHPGFDVLYACGISGQQRSLFSVDIDSGTVTLEAAELWAATCDNLAAPFGPVQCIPQ